MSANSPSNDKKPCTKCGLKRWVLLCEGCQTSFCIDHASEHRTYLSNELGNIEQQYVHLQHIYNQHEKRQEHPLFSQIDVWEHDTISKIQQTAETARTELQQMLDESNNRMKTILNHFRDELFTGRENDHFTETELHQWKEKLINIKEQLETPCDIELITDKNLTPIHLIKVITTKQNTMIKIPSYSQPIELCRNTNDIDSSCNNELDKPQLNNADIRNNSAPEDVSVLQSTEPSVIPKEEPENILESCDVLPIECQDLLDPNEKNDLLVLQLPSTIQSQIPDILNKQTNHSVQIFNDKVEFLHILKHSKQITVFIDIIDMVSDERNHLLDTISESDDVHSIYIHGIPLVDDNDRSHFFQRYTKIKAMFENEHRLIVQWFIDTANEYKKIGDIYIDRGDKDRGRFCFEEGIKLYKQLSVFLNENRCVR
ncbi:unnamed protein product [Adineta steineri]|uniref:B box-type domain-containing protein n=1 Tax=Adineta steineri TaxID=433720 RepID=A0A814ELS4_9BILA|nr:unnamed protein product [Adineta steineri]CAF0969332.1 unnamed protein product [Adineta steineri]